MRWLWILAIILVIVPFAAATELADYGTVTSYYYNITTGMGTQTDYQVKFILSNSSGVSGYYAPDNIIYTNGTTRPDWYDVNATDGSDTPLKFWIENNTYTANNATAWVKVPSIAVGNTSTGKWYFGNAGQVASTMNGYATFPTFDDFLGSAINTTQWTLTGTPTLSGGIANFSDTSAGAKVISIAKYGRNYSYVSRLNFNYGTDRRFSNGWINSTGTSEYLFFYGADTEYSFLMNGGSTNTTNLGTGYGAYHVYNMMRVAPSKITLTSDNTYVLSSTVSSDVSILQLPVSTGVKSSSKGAISYADWIFVAKSVGTPPTTSSYSTTSTGGGDATLSASFTDVPDPSSVGQAVALTDTSTGSPATWNWTIDGVLTNSTQNAAYIFSTAGSYPIFLNVTNATGAWSNTSATHTVVNASGYTPQDVWMEGQYNQTFHITSSSDGAPLAANYITSDGQSGTASATGYAFVTEGFGVYTITVSLTGYATKTVSFIVDEDGTTEIQLTPSSSQNPNTNIIYTPHQVRIYTVDAYGVPLIGTNITINYLASSLPSTDTNWLIKAYGIEAGVAADMVNSSVAMTGYSADDGSNTFTLFGSLTYGITLTNATVGANCYKRLAPIDSSYRIYCPTTGQTAVNNTLTAVNTSRLTFYRLNATGGYNLSMIYEDQSGYTTNLVFNVYDYSAGRTLVYTKDWGNPGTSQVVDNYSVYVPLGKEYQWQYNATKV